MRDEALFARWFGGESWRPHRVALAALFGLPHEPRDATDVALYREHSGREELPTGPAREGWWIKGRRAGGSIIAALIAVFLACFRSYALAPGERGTLMVLAA